MSSGSRGEFLQVTHADSYLLLLILTTNFTATADSYNTNIADSYNTTVMRGLHLVRICYSYNTSLVVPTDSYNTSLFLPHRKLFQLENS